MKAGCSQVGQRVPPVPPSKNSRLSGILSVRSQAGRTDLLLNYAVKSSYVLSFLESVPAVAAKLKDAHTKDRKFEDVVKSVEQATVLVLVY